MKLHCLGTAGYHPSQTRHTSCYYVSEKSLLLDAGTGMFRLLPLLKDVQELDIILSHAHLDHVFGLTMLIGFEASSQLQVTRIHGNDHHLREIREHLFSQSIFPAQPNIEWCSFSGTTEIAGAKVHQYEQPHPGKSFGYRIEWPERSLAYITDTTAADEPDVSDWLELDLLIHECNFPDEHRDFAIQTGHSHLSSVLKFIEAADPKQTVLTHFSPYHASTDSIGFAATIKNWPSLREATISLAQDEQSFDF